MSDPTRAVRMIVVEVNQATSDALDRREAAEGLNASTLFCRAMQVYDALAEEQGAEGWRVGRHYDIHVYEGDRPVATFFTARDARRAVEAVNGVGG